MGKQITDLTQTNSFDNGDLLLVRKSAAGVDNKIAQADFIKSIGNTAIDGFVAVSNNPNELTLSTVNGVTIDSYYEGMIISFISPIASTGLVKIQIGALPLTELYQYGSTNTIILEISDYVTAIYTGTKFYQTNMVTNTIYTNEYVATGVVAPDEQTTTYALASAIGANKIQYYRGMSSLFTTDVASKGAVLLNIDGLGIKNLTDQVGDNIPFNLAMNETVMAIYNGTNFIKNVFATIDLPAPPIDPQDPIIPPENKETINVGPGLPITTIADGIAQLIESYGENGGNRFVTIQLAPNFVHTGGLFIQSLTPWITIQSDTNGNVFDDSVRIFNGAISFTGKFIMGATTSFIYRGAGNGYAIVKDAEITSNYIGNGVTYCVTADLNDGLDSAPPIVFENVNVNNFNVLFFASNSGASGVNRNRGSFKYTTGVVVMKQGGNGYILQSDGDVTLTNINFGNVNRINGGSGLIYLTKNFNFTNVSITTSSNEPLLGYFNVSGTGSGFLTTCTMRNTTTNAVYALTLRGPVTITGGDYRHPNSSTNNDIFVDEFPQAIINLQNNPLATYKILPPGQTVPPQ